MLAQPKHVTDDDGGVKKYVYPSPRFKFKDAFWRPSFSLFPSCRRLVSLEEAITQRSQLAPPIATRFRAPYVTTRRFSAYTVACLHRASYLGKASLHGAARRRFRHSCRECITVVSRDASSIAFS